MILTTPDFTTSRTGTIAGFNEQCVSLFWDFNQSVAHNEPYSAPGAADLWTFPWWSYDKVQDPAYGDWASWSGTVGPYQNEGSGHVAMFVSSNGDGTGQFFSQNPNAAAVITLSLTGIQGYLRMKPLTDDELFLRGLDVQLP